MATLAVFFTKPHPMKNLILSAGVLAVGIIATAFTFSPSKEEIKSLDIGAAAPMSELQLIGTDGDAHSLMTLKKEKGLLVVFSCNTCPFVVGTKGTEGWEGRYADIQAECEKLGFGMVLINSNEAKRDKGDSMEDMVARARSNGFKKIPYVIDPGHKLADAFGARTTPHVFLFNSDLELTYKGAIDDNCDSSKKVKEHYLEDALKQTAAGKAVKQPETRPVGCSIKRV